VAPVRGGVIGAILGAALLASGAAGAATLVGTVVRVSDGDTVWLRTADAARRPVKLRLDGLDAPERCQPGGPQARAALEARVIGRRVIVETRARDGYGRTIGQLRSDGVDVGAWLVGEGHAWDHRFRGRPGPYAALERQARAAGRGVFADPAALEPRQFRRLHGACG
jgi:micrococcal nuclease